MKFLLHVAVLLFLMSPATAQDYHRVDSIVNKYPKAFWSPEKLATRIRADFNSDSTRTRAAYVWIARHVRYDVKKYMLMKQKKYVDRLRNQARPFNIETYRRKVALRTLRTKKGVCGDYAVLFNRLCQLINVPSEIIQGHGKTLPEDIGRLPVAVNHGWNAVKINKTWRLIDVTWGSGYLVSNTEKFRFHFNDEYFFTPPDLFALKHFPQDERWLLTESNDSIYAGLPLYHQLRKDIRILNPSAGLIDNRSKYGIQFDVVTDREVWITHAYYRDRRKPHELREGAWLSKGSNTYIIPPPRFTHTYLTVYIDGTAFATYKVKSKKFLRSPFAGQKGTSLASR
jgi:hypothetical protein